MPGQPLTSEDACPRLSLPVSFVQNFLQQRNVASALSRVAGECLNLASVTKELDSVEISLISATPVAVTWKPWSQSHLSCWLTVRGDPPFSTFLLF